MRVFLLIYKSALFTPAVVEHIAVSSTRFEIAGVGGVGAKKSGSFRLWIRAQTDYWGAWAAMWITAASVIRALMGRLPIPRAFRRLSSVALACETLELPYEEVLDVNDPSFVASLEQRKVDLIVCFQQQIFGRAILNVAPKGCINVHTGILPGYRGFKPVFWMHARKEEELGVTVHRMEREIDVGEIVTQRRWKRRPNSSVLENLFWSYRSASHAIVEAIEIIAGVSSRSEKYDEISSDSPYFKAPNRDERLAEVKAGTRMI